MSKKIAERAVDGGRGHPEDAKRVVALKLVPLAGLVVDHAADLEVGLA
jgi:hypothetical protein